MITQTFGPITVTAGKWEMKLDAAEPILVDTPVSLEYRQHTNHLSHKSAWQWAACRVDAMGWHTEPTPERAVLAACGFDPDKEWEFPWLAGIESATQPLLETAHGTGETPP